MQVKWAVRIVETVAMSIGLLLAVALVFVSKVDRVAFLAGATPNVPHKYHTNIILYRELVSHLCTFL